MTSGYIFLAAFILIFFVVTPILFLVAFTTKGRRLFLKLSGNKVIKDFGIFSENRLFGNIQILSLLLCERKGSKYFIIEESERLTSQGGLTVYLLKISPESLKKIGKYLTES